MWRKHRGDLASVVAAVKRVARQPFVQLLTILDELMAAIFFVFLECKEQNLIEQTYASLSGVLCEANKSTNAKYKRRVQRIESHFQFARVWCTLAGQQSRLRIALEEATAAQHKEVGPQLQQRSAEMIRQLQHSIKGVKKLFNIIKRSCEIETEAAVTPVLRE